MLDYMDSLHSQIHTAYRENFEYALEYALPPWMVTVSIDWYQHVLDKGRVQVCLPRILPKQSRVHKTKISVRQHAHGLHEYETNQKAEIREWNRKNWCILFEDRECCRMPTVATCVLRSVSLSPSPSKRISRVFSLCLLLRTHGLGMSDTKVYINLEQKWNSLLERLGVVFAIVNSDHLFVEGPLARSTIRPQRHIWRIRVPRATKNVLQLWPPHIQSYKGLWGNLIDSNMLQMINELENDVIHQFCSVCRQHVFIKFKICVPYLNSNLPRFFSNLLMMYWSIIHQTQTQGTV